MYGAVHQRTTPHFVIHIPSARTESRHGVAPEDGRSQFSRGDVCAPGLPVGVEATAVGDHEDGVLAIRLFVQSHALLHRAGHGFFYQHWNARAEGGHGRGAVQSGGHGDHDSVNFSAVHYGFGGVVNPGARISTGEPFPHLGRRVGARDQFTAIDAVEGTGLVRPHAPNSNGTYSDHGLPFRGVCRARTELRYRQTATEKYGNKFALHASLQ